jgi:3-oxoadipate CoA-transferase alpha subunit
MINKVFASVQDAITDVHDGASIMVGGFGFAGTPFNLVQGLIEKKVKRLTIICNSFNNIMVMEDRTQVSKVIMSFPVAPTRAWVRSPLEAAVRSGEIEVEHVPQGTLVERMRAGGAGLAGFYTPTGVGTIIERGKEKREFGGREYLLETALRADFAFIKARKGDTRGNLVYRMTARNFNPIMAMAANVTIAEVEEIVEPGAIDPDIVVTPGIFVQRVIKAPPISVPFRRSKESQATLG